MNQLVARLLRMVLVAMMVVTAVAVRAEQAPYDGIDVSRHQGDIDWEQLASDRYVQFVYLKASEGGTYRSPVYSEHRRRARKAGLKVGSYHFVNTRASAHKQAENFISVAHRESQDLIPVIDVETKGTAWTAQQLRDSVLMIARLLEDYYGCKPMIYTNVRYFNARLGEAFAHFPLMIAGYQPDAPQLECGAQWTLWQFTDEGRVPGIKRAVDLNRFADGYNIDDIAYHYTPSRGWPWWARALVTLLVLGGVVAAVVAWRRRQEKTAPRGRALPPPYRPRKTGKGK